MQEKMIALLHCHSNENTKFKNFEYLIPVNKAKF